MLCYRLRSIKKDEYVGNIVDYNIYTTCSEQAKIWTAYYKFVDFIKGVRVDVFEKLCKEYVIEVSILHPNVDFDVTQYGTLKEKFKNVC